MADVYIPLNRMTENTLQADPTTGASTAASVGTSDEGIIGRTAATGNPQDPFKARKLVLRLVSAGAAVVTVKAGDNPPAHGAKYGDLTLSVGAATKFVTLEAARYMQEDGTIRLTSATAATVVSAFVLPNSH